MSNNSNEEGALKVTSCLLPYVDAQIPVVIVSTGNEDNRFLRNEQQILTQSKMATTVYQWDVTGKLTDTVSGAEATIQTIRGVIEWFSQDPPKPEDLKKDDTAIDLVAQGPLSGSVLIVFDALAHMADPQKTGHSNPTNTRIIKNKLKDFLRNRRTLVLTGTRLEMPPELEGVASSIEYPLPDLNYLRAVVRNSCKWFAPKEKKNDPKAWLQLSESQEIEIATLLRGFRALEADNILAKACRRNTALRKQDSEIPTGFDIDTIRKAKIETIRNSGAMRIVLPQRAAPGEATGTSLIGGAGTLKEWWNVRRKLFDAEARHEGIDIPRGAVIFGPGGTGKDWTVERIADAVGWTLIHADMGALKAPLQGQTHRNLRDMLATAEAQAPCFLAISEFEKMFAGAMAGGTGALDGGTSSEVYATFLNWMQNRKVPVFVWGLANSMDHVPLPALRAGRFDRIFFMDLPGPMEREEIFRVHLNRTGWAPEEFNLDLPLLAEKTENYTGSEIRKIVDEAITIKYINDGPRPIPLVTAHLVQAIGEVRSTYDIRPAEIDGLRKFAKDGNFIRANSSETNSVSAPKVGKSIRSSI